MKKKIMIFTNTCGAGHVTATMALNDYLSDKYELHEVDFLQVLKAIDLLQSITFNYWCADQAYNYCMRKRYYRLVNIICKLGIGYFHIRKKKINKLIAQFIAQEKPDMVISVTPLINGAILAAAQQLNIPFLLIPTDLDVRMFIKELKSPTYTKFHMTMPFKDPDVQKTIEPAKLKKEQLIETGFILRADFLEQKNKEFIKQHYAIPPEKPIILVMMGGQGSHSIESYTQQLAQLSFPVHLIICLGKFKAIRPKIEAIELPPHITITIVEFTPHISDLMAVADLIISKSGSVSVNEIIYMNVPVLLDAAGMILTWEFFNHTFIMRHGFGDRITKPEDIIPMVSKVLLDSSYYQKLKRNLVNYPKKNPSIEIPKLIEQMLRS